MNWSKRKRQLRNVLSHMKWSSVLLQKRDAYCNAKMEADINRRVIENEDQYHIQANGYIFSPRGMNVSFYLPAYRTDTIQKMIVANENYYEFEYLKYVFEKYNAGVIRESVKGKAVLDIGANIGNHSIYFVKECYAMCVHSFEPVCETFEILSKNIRINHLENEVILHKYGVGGKSSKASIAMKYEDNCGGTSVKYDNMGDLEIVAIDDLKLEEDIALVKIDVEGFEAEVIKGMIDTIKRNKPYMLIEIRPQYFEEILDVLKPFIYKYEQMDELNYIFSPIERSSKN